MATEYRWLYELIIGLTSATDRRLLIDLTCIREAYELRELREIVWIKSRDNPNDSLTKLGEYESLKQIMTENKIKFKPSSGAERKSGI